MLNHIRRLLVSFSVLFLVACTSVPFNTTATSGAVVPVESAQSAPVVEASRTQVEHQVVHTESELVHEVTAEPVAREAVAEQVVPLQVTLDKQKEAEAAAIAAAVAKEEEAKKDTEEATAKAASESSNKSKASAATKSSSSKKHNASSRGDAPRVYKKRKAKVNGGNAASNSLLASSKKLLNSGQYRMAANQAERALRVSPRNPHAYYQLALIYKKKGDCVQASRFAVKGLSQGGLSASLKSKLSSIKASCQ